MPVINIDTGNGRPVPVPVDDSFMQLSPDAQNKTVDEIAADMSSYGSDLQGGLHDLGTSVAQGLHVVGGVMQRNGMPQWGGAVSGAGDSVQGITPDAPAGNDPTGRLAQDIKGGNWSNALGDVPHAVVRALPSTAPILAGGALAGPVGAGLAAGAESLGPTAYARAANNGRADPTTGDVLGSLPNVAAQGTLGAMLPGGAANKIANPILRAGAKAGFQAAAGAGMDAANQVGQSAGTDKGISFDPYQSAAAGATQGAMGVAREAPDVLGGAVKPVTNRLMAATLDGPKTTEDATSVLQVAQDMASVRQADINDTGRARPATDIANSLKTEYTAKLNSAITGMRQLNMLDAVDAMRLRSLVNDQALRHNNTITEGGGYNSLFEAIQDLNLPTEAKAQLSESVRNLNTVSSQSFVKNTVGPAQMALAFLGKHVGGAALPVLGAGKALGGAVGGGVGQRVDQFLGTNTPSIVLQSMNAARALQKAGVDPSTVQPGLTGLQNLTGAIDSARATITPPAQSPAASMVGDALSRASVGLPATDPVPVNVPIKSAPAPVPPQTPAATLQPSTPADVRAALAQDDGTPSQGQPPSPSAPPLAVPQAQPAAPSTLPLTAPAAHPAAPLWERLTANGDPNHTRQAVRDAAAQVYSPDQIASLDAHSGGFNIASTIAPIQAKLANPPAAPAAPLSRPAAILAELDAKNAPDTDYRAAFSTGTKTPLRPGQTWRGRLQQWVAQEAAARAASGSQAGPGTQTAGPPLDASGRPIRSLPAYNLAGRNWPVLVKALAAQHPDHAAEIIRLAGVKDPAAKQAEAGAYVAQHPDAAKAFPEWFLSHGRKG